MERAASEVRPYMANLAVGGSHPVRLPVPVAELGEGPHWDVASNALYWVDVPAGLVHRLDEDGSHVSWDAGQPVGAVVPRASGGLVVTARDGFLALDTSTGAVTPLVSVEADLPGNRMNDGSCDRAGRFYAGTMAADESPGAGSLYRPDPPLPPPPPFPPLPSSTLSPSPPAPPPHV